MTVGIYTLTFGDCLTYVGQSRNINRRFYEHIRDLDNHKHTEKIMHAYTLYGYPILSIVCLCSEENLEIYEDIFIKYYNSSIVGINTLASSKDIPKPNNAGVRHGLSKYSEQQIIEVLKLLVQKPFLLYEHISDITSVNYQTIANIAALSEHTWLKNIFVEEYKLLILYKGKRNFGRPVNTAEDKGIRYRKVMSPEGVIYDNITNVAKFMKENNINSKTFYELLNGKRNKCVGWVLV